MMARVLLLGWLILCGAPMRAHAVPSCTTDDNDRNCEIKIGIREFSKGTGTSKRTMCLVHLKDLKQFWIGFKRVGGVPVDITWRIDSPPKGYAFAASGVVFDNPAPDLVYSQATPTTSTWTNHRQNPSTDNEYTITVTNGTVTCKLDPWVRN